MSQNKRPIIDTILNDGMSSKRHAAEKPPPPSNPPPRREAEPIECLPPVGPEIPLGKIAGISDKEIRMRALITGREAGVVIGHKGSHVGLLRDNFDFKVTVSKAVANATDRVVTFSGPLSKFGQAIEFLAEKFTAEKTTSDEASKAIKKVTLRFLVPASRLGFIIGKGGMRIKEMQATSGAHMFSQDQNLPNSTERILTITGDSEQLQIAAFSLASIIGYEYEITSGREPLILYDPAYRPEPAAGSSAAYQRYPALPPEHQAAIAYYYSQMQLMAAQYPEMAAQYHQQYQLYYAQMQAASIPPPTVSTITEQIRVPNRYVGAIIGKGGSFIKEIKMNTTSDVKIESLVEGETERLANITGNINGNKAALQMIHAKIELEKNRSKKQRE